MSSLVKIPVKISKKSLKWTILGGYSTRGFDSYRAVIAYIIESLESIPAKISQPSGPKPDQGPKPNPSPRGILNSLKDGLQWLAEKAASAVPGILGSII